MSTKPAGLSSITRWVALLLATTAVGCVGTAGEPVGPGTGGTPGSVGGSGPAGSGGSAPGTGSQSGSGGVGLGGAGASVVVPPGSGGNIGAGGTTGNGGASACAPMATTPRRLWRLSNLQYSNSMRDLLKLATNAEITGGGTALDAFFSKDTEQVDSRLQFSYYEAAQTAVNQINPLLLAACMPAEVEATCAQRLATSLATTAFRRPVPAAEVTDLMVLYTEGRKKDFATGIRLMVEGILLAPSFAYRSELGTGTTGSTTLTSHEVAAQLSYLFLDSLPDAPLTTAATSNSLTTPAAIATQVDRLMALPKAKENVTRIVVDWFGARGTFGKSAAFPMYTPEFERDLVTSNRLFIEDVLFNGTKRLEDLVLSNRMFVSPRLAPVYGFTVPAATTATQFVAVNAPAGQRAGILTQPGMMAYKATTDDTSIVKRGRFVSDDILCGPAFPDPPEDLIQMPDVQAALKSFTTEAQRTEYRMVTNAACKSCHLRMDPPGVFLETIDPIGRYRTTMPDGSMVKSSWNIAFSPSLTGTFNNPVQFAEGVVKDKVFSSCATRKLASYALGANQPLSCELTGVRDRFESSADHSVTTLLREIAVASFMRTRGAL